MPTFADLYDYCYLVASVVGLVCIRIFGYTDPRAEKLAEETGIAFQLTNILRDVAEDASRNRVYLPLEDLAAHHVSLDTLLHRAPGAPPTSAERALLEAIANRAENYYKSAEALMPLIDSESRPALWVLVSIYHALLKRIESAHYDVFSQSGECAACRKDRDTRCGALAHGVDKALWKLRQRGEAIGPFATEAAKNRDRGGWRRGRHERRLRAGRGRSPRATCRAARLSGRARVLVPSSRRQ